MDSGNNSTQTPRSNMNRLPSIQSLMSPPPSKSLQSPSSTPLAKAERLPSYSPENTLAPITNLISSKKSQVNNEKTPEMAKDNVLLSPPVSPWTGKENTAVLQEGPAVNAHDPILYPSYGAETAAHQLLFPSKRHEDDAITMHLAKSVEKFTRIQPPTREEYRLTLACVGRAYNKNPGAYMKRQREEEENLYYKTKRLCAEPGQRYVRPTVKTASRPVPIAPRPPRQLRKPIADTASIAPIDRPRRTPKATPKASPDMEIDDYPTKTVARTKRVNRTSPQRAKLVDIAAKGIPQHTSLNFATFVPSVTPEQRVPVPKPNDKDYESVPDYCPPLSTLKDSSVALKTDWPSNNPYNNSNDPDRQRLDEFEVKVAETLRLTCAQYLTSKRRIFEARVNALRVGKQFRKTDSQKACKIDVNKASRLFAAFEKVGWFDASHFQRFL